MQRFDRLSLSRETNIIFPTLRSRQKHFFPKLFEQTKKFYLSAKGLHGECSASISVKTICFEHLQQGSYEKLNLGIFLQEYVQASGEDNFCVPFLQLKFLVPTLRHIFCSPKASNIYGESDFESSFSRNKLGKYIFLWFKKRDFYF